MVNLQNWKVSTIIISCGLVEKYDRSAPLPLFLHPSHLAVAFIDLPPLYSKAGENICFIAYLPIWFYFIGLCSPLLGRYPDCAVAQIATAETEDYAFKSFFKKKSQKYLSMEDWLHNEMWSHWACSSTLLKFDNFFYQKISLFAKSYVGRIFGLGNLLPIYWTNL